MKINLSVVNEIAAENGNSPYTSINVNIFNEKIWIREHKYDALRVRLCMLRKNKQTTV